MCTEFILPAATGKRVSGRTMDFGQVFPWAIATIPEATSIEAFEWPWARDRALSWEAALPCIGVSGGIDFYGMGLRLTDALNTKGLSAAALWLPGSVYPKADDAPKGAKLVSAFDIVSWAVTTYGSVKELAKDLVAIRNGEKTDVAFWDPLQLESKYLPGGGTNLVPLHFQFHDATGASLVLEFRDGHIELTDNTDLGVMTNAPFLDWQRTNVANYLDVTNADPEARRIVGMEVAPPGHGSGTVALSTSPLPASRFVRVAFLLDFAQTWLNSGVNDDDTIAYVMSLLGNVTVLHGECVKQSTGEDSDFTQWALARDHANPALYVRTDDSIGTWKVDFTHFDLARGAEPASVKIGAANDLPFLKPS